MSNNDEWLTIKELGALLKVCRRTIYYLLERGALPAPLKLSDRTVRFNRFEVEKVLTRRKKRVKNKTEKEN